MAVAFQKRGYQVVYFDDPDKAIDEMRFTDFAGVVLHSEFEPGGLGASKFHKHMRLMTMGKRRYIYYLLIGPGFHTLYDLEALANSANLVLNDSEIAHVDTILKKGFHDFDALFGSFVRTLKARGIK